ncbi:MAG: hypothetical protein RLZZ511_2110 [Cyanobacteriota bacterium]|jgi:hypothetical protein
MGLSILCYILFSGISDLGAIPFADLFLICV